MPSLRLPQTKRDVASWAAFWAAFAILPIVVVVGLRPSAEDRISPHGPEVAVAHQGHMLIDQRSSECQQISFDNDTVEITASAMVSCSGRHGFAAAAQSSSSAGSSSGMFGAMRKLFGSDHPE